MRQAIAYFDGGVRETRGPHACAIVLELPDGRDIEDTQYLGPIGTVNQAEYRGLILALETALSAGVTHLTIRSDSKLIVEQSLGNWRVKEPSLRPLHRAAQDLARGFEEVKICWVSRKENKRADALVTALLDSVVGRKRRAA